MHLLQSSHEQYIYKLEAGDSIVIHKDCHHIYIILVGVLSVYKIFTNQEIYAINIISNGHIFSPIFSDHYSTNYYYKLEALSKAYVISLTSKELSPISLIRELKHRHSRSKHYNLTEILIHKNIKYRLIHLFLLLSEHFGFVEYNKIIIPLTLPYKTLSIIIGSNTSAIGRTIRILHKNKVLRHHRTCIIIYQITDLNDYIYK